MGHWHKMCNCRLENQPEEACLRLEIKGKRRPSGLTDFRTELRYNALK